MKIRSKITLLFFPLIIMLILTTRQSVSAANSPVDGEWGGTPHLGFSPYTGLLGIEIQNSHFGLTLGMPASIGFKYYFDEKGDRLFLGAHAMRMEFDHDERKDGVLYKENKTTVLGAGLGYKWQWEQGWNITLSLSIVHYDEELKNSATSRTEDSIESFPGLTFGYRFK